MRATHKQRAEAPPIFSISWRWALETTLRKRQGFRWLTCELDTYLERHQRSRVANAEADVTGLLLFREHRFLRLLEGPKSAVREKMSFISEDPRHEQVRVLLEEHVLVRQFPEWTMGYAADGALRATVIPGYRTTFDDIDSLPNNQAGSPVASALRELIRWFRIEQDTTAAAARTARPL